MKILVSGSNGMLGSVIMEQSLKRGFNVKALLRSDMEFSSLAKLKKRIQDFSPNVIIHCAANTNVELCEKEPDACYRDNTALTELLVNASKNQNCSFVLMSSTGIYGEHKATPYCEFDTPFPTTHHHNSKLLAENIVLTLHPNPLIIRTGWLFGGNVNKPKNFVINRIKEMAGSEGRIFSDSGQVGNPTWVNDVVSQIFLLIEQGWNGVFNCVNYGSVSRFEYVREISKLVEQNVQVLPAESSEFKRVAKVSNNEAAINAKLDIYELNIMPHWKASLANYLDSNKREIKNVISRLGG